MVLGAAGGTTLGGGWGKLEGATELQVTEKQVQNSSFSTLQESADKTRRKDGERRWDAAPMGVTECTLYTCTYWAGLFLRFLGL